jgi:LysM repeat protein
VGSPEARGQAQQLLRQALESLNDGDEEKARSELQEIRELDPDNKQAACLMKGITADPAAALGSHAYPYTVRRGESLWGIARRALGDGCEFWLLARYNNIKVPKQLGTGQVIRIPGKVALAPPGAAPAKPAATNRVPPAERAKPPAPEPGVKEPAKPVGPSKEEIAKQEQIQRHHGMRKWHSAARTSIPRSRNGTGSSSSTHPTSWRRRAGRKRSTCRAG